MTTFSTLTTRARMRPKIAEAYASVLQELCKTEAAENLYNTTAQDLIDANAWIHAVLDSNGQLVSACTTASRGEGNAFDLCGVVTDPRFVRKGLATRAIEEAVQSVRDRGGEWVFLVVRVWHGVVSPGPDRLYRGLGWHPTGHFCFSTITDAQKCRHLTADYNGGYVSLEYVRELPAEREAA
ncbi:GNAT family N-acetyltransferase [uncultured Tateyamaria sp.]|uniref:GNAT family N-acetyltransferase n=1 Tax=uncultured Tateyamaria sp. TaxID=455651 RepID=UPI00262894D4|nr:GNAT family N-acetyltransferase [uncultured Tateyamaria sp.]